MGSGAPRGISIDNTKNPRLVPHTMGLIAEYEVTFADLPLVDVAAALPDTKLRLRVGQPNQAGPPPFVLRASADSYDRLEEAITASGFVDEYALVGREYAARLYRIVPSAGMEEQLEALDDRSRLRELAHNESVVDSILVTPRGWRQRRWFSDREAFEAYTGFWRENGESFSLCRLTESTAATDRRDALSERQREALLTAYEMGYFEIPRATTLGAVADELGISVPAASERLRRAQTGLVESALESDGAITGLFD